MGNNKSKLDNKNYHFIYMYVNDKIDIPDLSKDLLNIIIPNMKIIQNSDINLKIFQITNDDLKNKNLSNLLKKNNINKLPALKIKNNKTSLYIGNNDIINYYVELLGDIFIKRAQLYQQQITTKYQQVGKNSNRTHNNGNYNNSNYNNGNYNNGNYNNGNYNNGNYNNGNYNNEIYNNDNTEEETSIHDNKNIMSKFDEMVKFRSELKGPFLKNTNTNNSSLNNSSSNNLSSNNLSSNNLSSNKKIKKIKSSIKKKDLEDTPFKEGDLDDLDIDLDDNLDFNGGDNITDTLKKINYSAPSAKNNGYGLGDDNADDEKDLLMERAFWENN